MKDELKNTSIQITCLDEEGNVLKRVTSGDSGDIEDNEAGNSPSAGSETDPSAGSETDPSAGSGTDPSAGSGTESGTVYSGSGIIPTPTDPEDDQPGD